MAKILPLPYDDNQECNFCLTSIEDVINLGEKFSFYGLIVHYQCLLLTDDIKQSGDDNEGILGFLPHDILDALSKGRQNKCTYCNSLGATIKCQKCDILFHRTCGLVHNSLSVYDKNYYTYCELHRPRQAIPFNIIEEGRKNPPTCVVCLETVNVLDDFHSLWAPCCKKTWYHFKCLQNLASNQAAFFKCAVCSDKKRFKPWVIKYGIFIPKRDASWELEPGAFESHQIKLECNAESCVNPHGRCTNIAETVWELLVCGICGSQGIHRQCSNVESTATDWECLECQQIINSINRDISQDVRENVSLEASCSGTYSNTTNMGSPPTSALGRLRSLNKQTDVDIETNRPDDGPTQNTNTSITRPCTVRILIDNALRTRNAHHKSHNTHEFTKSIGNSVASQLTSKSTKYKCEFPKCTSAFKRRNHLTRHIQNHVKIFKCEFPGCTFVSKGRNNFLQHRKIHAHVKRFKCEYPGCTSVLKRLDILKQHSLIHEKIFKCKFPGCTSAFNRHDYLRKHNQYHTGERPFICEFPGCTLAFKQHIYLRQHSKVHTEKMPFKCEFSGCNFAFKLRDHLTQHINNHSEEMPFKCEFSGCNFEFKLRDHLTQHINNHSEEMPFKCQFPGCTSAFNRHDYLRKHNQYHTGERPFICEFPGCALAFKLHIHLRQHNLIHSEEKPFKCEFSGCNFAFKRRDYLTQHINNHSEEMPFKCEFPGCTSAFNRRRYLTIHSQTHEKIFKCEFPGCTSAFNRHEYLRKHNQYHTGERSFICEFPGCALAFKLHIQLRKHNLIHSEEKPFKCEFSGCTSAFNRHDYLKKHNRYHTGKRPFICEFPGCTLVFKLRAQLKKHNLIHSEDMPFKCEFPECTSSFKLCSNLTIHSQTHEKIFKCEFPGCTSAFNRHDYLRKHNQYHTGEKQFKCEFPGCTFKLKPHVKLKSHNLYHSKERPFKCEFPGCHSAFKQSHHLRDHNMTHKTKSLNCKFNNCSKTFRYPYERFQHSKRAHSYKCNFDGCNFGFKILPDLTEHEKIHSRSNTRFIQDSHQITDKLLNHHSNQTHYKPQHKIYNNASPVLSEEEEEFNLKIMKFNDVKTYKCNYDNCTVSYRTQTRLAAHKWKHEITVMPDKCDLNGSTSSPLKAPTKEKLLRSKNDIGTYKSPNCDFVSSIAEFQSSSDIIEHQESNVDLMSQQSSLNLKRQRTLTDENPFRSNDLVEHIKYKYKSCMAGPSNPIKLQQWHVSDSSLPQKIGFSNPCLDTIKANSAWLQRYNYKKARKQLKKKKYLKCFGLKKALFTQSAFHKNQPGST